MVHLACEASTEIHLAPDASVVTVVVMVHLACEASTDPQSVALSTELLDHE
jgi:hypothetical protein